MELRAGYEYHAREANIRNATRNVLQEHYDGRVVRVEKANGRRVWARKDYLVAIAEWGYPGDECWACGEWIPHVLARLTPSPVEGLIWVPDRDSALRHGLRCLEDLMQQERHQDECRRRDACFFLEAEVAEEELEDIYLCETYLSESA